MNRHQRCTAKLHRIKGISVAPEPGTLLPMRGLLCQATGYHRNNKLGVVCLCVQGERCQFFDEGALGFALIAEHSPEPYRGSRRYRC